MIAWGLLAVQRSQADDLSIFNPAAPPAESIRTLSILLFAITGLIFVLVEGILIYNLMQFRRAAKAANGVESEPPQVYGGHPIEIAWTVAPTLIVVILVLVLSRTLWEVDVPAAPPQAGDHALHVTVIGRQWWWEYHYDTYDGRPLGFITANELHVPATTDSARRPIYLQLQSADVCHSFWVPRLAGKTDLIPGQTNHTWFETRERGLFLGQCAEYCGTQHAGMLLRVVVDSPEDFEQWLKLQAQPARDDPEARAGKAAFLAEACVNCHRVRGTAAAGTYAPDLTHLMSRETLAAGLFPNTSANLDRWVADPQQLKYGCLMPAFTFSDSRRNEIVRYLTTLH
jgi:cytochrome c oxidase subunit II